MKILGSTITTATKHSLEATETRQESFRVLRDAQTPIQKPSIASVPAHVAGDRLTISETARQAYESSPAKTVEPSISIDSEFFGLSPENRVLIAMLENVLGIKIRLPQATDVLTKPKAQPISSPQSQPVAQVAQQPEKAGLGLSDDLNESYMKSEKSLFAAKTVVNTADGKQISVELRLNMSQLAAQRSPGFRVGDAKAVDPLVINYSGSAADFASSTLQFNIDADWSGEDVLLGLGDTNVGAGAIFVGSVGTDDSAKDAANQLRAHTGTGLSVGESGGSGTVQQADLAVGKR